MIFQKMQVGKMQFEFATAGRIMFGPGIFTQAGKIASELGSRALLVHGFQNQALDSLVSDLSNHGLKTVAFRVDGEPDVPTVQVALEIARMHSCNVIIAIGGGSTLDTGKAVAGLLPNPGDIYNYLEVVGKGLGLKNPGLPLIAIPTTAGTGSEVTRNAVLGIEIPGQPGELVKVSLRSAYMLPRVALVDPELTFSLPPEVTAATGLDALTQLIEPFLSNKANPLTDGICREGMTRVGRSLLRAYRQGDDATARTDMSIASLFGGLALANARLGAVHGFAAPLGGIFHAPHGAICARLLPVVMEFNFNALSQRDPESLALSRFDEIARLITGRQEATGREALSWLNDLLNDLHIPGLAQYGLTPAHFDKVVSLAARASSMQGNPILLTDSELRQILSIAL